MPTALIIFDQGGATPAGEAREGTLAGGAVTVTNTVDLTVTEWTIYLRDVPTYSALVTGTLATGMNNTPTANFTPDVPGSYRIELEVTDGSTTDRDIRNFGVRNSRGIIVPPYQQDPAPLPVTGVGSKPNEQNYSGNLRGWAGSGTAGQMDQFFEVYDDLRPTVVTSTPFSAINSSTEGPLYYVDLATIGGPAVFNLPIATTWRVGQRYRIIAGDLDDTDTVTVNAQVGTLFGGTLTSLTVLPGTGAEVVYAGGVDWIMPQAKIDHYERTIVGGIEDTDSTGFVAIGTTALDPADFPNNNGAITFQAILETTNVADAAEVRLFNVTTASVVAGSTLSTTSLTPVEVSATIALAAGSNVYEAQLRLQTTGAPNRATCKQAQVMIDWLQP